jgi:hypothetical protein
MARNGMVWRGSFGSNLKPLKIRCGRNCCISPTYVNLLVTNNRAVSKETDLVYSSIEGEMIDWRIVYLFDVLAGSYAKLVLSQRWHREELSTCLK